MLAPTDNIAAFGGFIIPLKKSMPNILELGSGTGIYTKMLLENSENFSNEFSLFIKNNNLNIYDLSLKNKENSYSCCLGELNTFYLRDKKNIKTW